MVKQNHQSLIVIIGGMLGIILLSISFIFYTVINLDEGNALGKNSKNITYQTDEGSSLKSTKFKQNLYKKY